MAIRWRIILCLLASPSLAEAEIPQNLPAGAKLLSGKEVGQLLVGATMLGPIYTDGAPVSTTYLANGVYRRGSYGVVYTTIEGKYRIVEGGICEEYHRQQGCSYIARSIGGQPLLAWPPRDRGRKWTWTPFRVTSERPTGKL